MKLFAEFETREYLNMHLRTEVLVFEGRDWNAIFSKALDWAKNMTSTHSGSTTILNRILPHEEVVEHISNEIAYTLENPIGPKTDDGLEETDVRQLRYLSNLLQVMIAQEKTSLKKS